MANNDPGQVFTPNSAPDDAPQTVQPNQEVQIPMSSVQPDQQTQPALPSQPSNPPVLSQQPDLEPQPRTEDPVAQSFNPQAAPVQQEPAISVEPEAPNLPPAAPQAPEANEKRSPYVLETNRTASDGAVMAESDDGVISWTASEYIAHHKSTGWYIALVLATVGLAILVFWITGGDIVSVVVVLLVAIVFGVYAARKPREQEFAVGDSGIAIGQKVYPYSELKSFAIIDEGPFSSIVFMPMKRFMPLLSIYYDPKDEQQIFDLLASHLPNEQHGHDKIDRIMKKIRF